jgi:hypothetical protein
MMWPTLISWPGTSALYAYGLKLQGEPEKAAKMLDGRQDLDQLGNEGKAFFDLRLLFVLGTACLQHP